MGRPASPRTRTNQWERGQRSGVFFRAAGRAARPGLRVCRPWSAPGPCAAGRIPAPWTPGRAAQPATVGTGPSPVHAGGEAGGGSGLCQQPGKDAPAPRSPPPHPRPRAGCAPRGFGHAPLTSDDSSGPRPGDQSALSGTAECGAGRPQPPRACGLGGSAPSQLSGHTAQPPTNPSQNEATWRQRPRAGGRLCVRQAEARTAGPPGAVGCWLGKVLSVPHTYGQGDRPAPSAQRAYNGHWPSGQREAPQTHKGHADELGALLGEARVPLRGPLGVAAAGWAEQASVSSSPPPGRRSYFSIL